MRAFKFRDPDGHPLELLWLPEGQRRREWRDRSSAIEPQALFLGIDHSALAVRSTRRSLSFYGSLGLHVTGRSMNGGPTQSRLDGLGSTRVRVTRLRPASSAGPGLQLLAYQPVGRVRETSALFDLSTEWTTLGAVMAGGPSPGLIHDTDPGGPPTPLRKSIAVSDPDGHRFVLVSQ
jgi:catechol 2,3-dioxygenase-like lactoylglutathione lyase family enzyme